MTSPDTPKSEAKIHGPAESATQPDSAVNDNSRIDARRSLPTSVIGSGLLAQQPTPNSGETVAVAKVCPQCGAEYETGDRFCLKDGSPLRPKTGDDPLIGKVIADRYLILARLGEGGMGRVYLAEHVKMTRQCAIKVMNPALMNDSQSLARFAREASSAARILHPNVAAVFDYGDAGGVVYLVMEYVDGESLSYVLAEDGLLDPRRAIDIARQIADGLAAAHELGIVHRDLKPDNVIIARSRTGKETAKLVDFGIAKALTDLPEDGLTRSGLVIGTPEYMSPEQLLGDPVDARADIYSLGCILYQMLTGDQPFVADSREQMIRRRLHETPPHVRDLFPDLPRRLDTLIVHMLARSPKDRLASAADARDALDPSLTLGGWDPSSMSILQSGSANAEQGASVSADPLLQPTAPMPRQRLSGKRVVTAVAISAIALLGVLTLTPRIEDKAVPVAAANSPAATSASDPTHGQPAPALAAHDSLRSTVAAKATVTKPLTIGPTTPGQASAKAQTPTTQPAVDEEAWKEPLERFRGASARGDLVALANAAPSMSETQKHAFEQVYAAGDNIHSRSVIGAPVLAGDRAEVPFALVVTYLDKASKAQSSVRLEYRAVLVRHGARWDIAELQSP